MWLAIRHALTNLVIGLLAGGLLASLGLAGAPPAWRGPVIPAVACAAAIGIVTAVRRRKARTETGSEPRGRHG